MSGNNEDGGGCSRGCNSCLNYIRSIPGSVRNLTVRQCLIGFLNQVYKHPFRLSLIITNILLAPVAWFEFGSEFSIVVSSYCFTLLLCSFMTFFEPKGRMWGRCCNLVLCRGGREINRHAREQGVGAEQPPTGAMGGAVEDIQAEPSGSSDSVEPASTPSDDQQQSASSQLSTDPDNLRRSSTDPSTPSTSSTPLED